MCATKLRINYEGWKLCRGHDDFTQQGTMDPAIAERGPITNREAAGPRVGRGPIGRCSPSIYSNLQCVIETSVLVPCLAEGLAGGPMVVG